MRSEPLKLEPWWGLETGKLKLRHVGRILGRAAGIERVIMKGGIPLDRALAEHFRKMGGSMGSNDRRVLSAAAYGLARNREMLKRVKLPDCESSLLTLALLDQASEAQKVQNHDILVSSKASLDELASLRTKAFELLDANRDLAVADAPDEVCEAFSNLFSVPGFWLGSGNWPSVGEAFSQMNRSRFRQTLQLRVNTNLTSRDAVLEELRSQGLEATATARSPWGIAVAGRVNLRGLDAYRRGRVEVQDEGSQLAALACGPVSENDVILDICAGAGGKTLALAAMGAARVVAYDLDQSRLKKAGERIGRSGLKNIRLTDSPEREMPRGGYDIVLADAPCSSSGTLRRNPDVVWRWDEEGIKGFARTQLEVLSRSAGLVRPGGLLVYVTCSLHTAEDQEVVNEFLNKNIEYKREAQVAASCVWKGVEGAEIGTFRLNPGIEGYGGDWFFCSRLRRSDQA